MKRKELEIALTTYIAFKHNQDECSGFIDGYTQCQEDMANEIQSLIDGYNSKIDELYKHYKCGSSLLTLEQINTFEYLIVSNVIPNLKKLINKKD